MLDAMQAQVKTGAINDAFAAIGRTGETKMPLAKRNTEGAAWELHVSMHLLRLAEARKKTAHKAALRAGVVFDHEASPREVGTSEVVYAGDVVEIAVAVTTPGARLDQVAFNADLEKAGLERKLIDRLTVKHTLENRAPHKFTSALRVG